MNIMQFDPNAFSEAEAASLTEAAYQHGFTLVLGRAEDAGRHYATLLHGNSGDLAFGIVKEDRRWHSHDGNGAPVIEAECPKALIGLLAARRAAPPE